MHSQAPPRIAISSCLLGNPVRHDGRHRLDSYLRDRLGRSVQFVPVCPEVECGLPVPREAMRLVERDGGLRLLTRNSGIDHSVRMRDWARKKLDELERERLCGLILKSRSPSCGMRNIKVYTADGGVSTSAVGLFAQAFLERFPHRPAEDEERLEDAPLKENFITRIFVFQRWQELAGRGFSLSRLIDFHATHKLVLMAHAPKVVRELGALLAAGKKRDPEELAGQYVTTLMAALKLVATPRKNTNVLDHAMGYFKRQLSGDEKRELKTLIEQYYKGFSPLIVPITLLNHYVAKYSEPYLARQYYLNPHPLEVMLRNHV